METFEEQSRGMAQILADGLVQDLYFRNISALDDRIKVTLAQPSVRYLRLYDSAGQPVHAVDKANKTKRIGAGDPSAEEAVTGGWKVYFRGKSSARRWSGSCLKFNRCRLPQHWVFKPHDGRGGGGIRPRKRFGGVLLLVDWLLGGLFHREKFHPSHRRHHGDGATNRRGQFRGAGAG